MAISHALRQLLGIREAEERHRRTLLESATAELHRLQNALENSAERSMFARKCIASSVQSGDTADRVDGLEEVAASDRLRSALLRRVSVAQKKVDETRREYLEKRLERRQAESLVDAARAQEAIESNRRAQRELDDRHLRRRDTGTRAVKRDL